MTRREALTVRVVEAGNMRDSNGDRVRGVLLACSADMCWTLGALLGKRVTLEVGNVSVKETTND